MNISRFSEIIPKFLLRIWRYFYPFLIDILYYKKRTRKMIHQYWSEPLDKGNLPQDYLRGGKERSKFLVDLIQRYGNQTAKILEIGCNVGRNLNYLFLAGFTNLVGIELNKKAVQLLKSSYPLMAQKVKIYNFPVEKIIGKIKDNEFDIVFTLAVLMHIHPDSEWIFGEITRITKNYLITIENEIIISRRNFKRNYKEIFERLGMQQVEEINLVNTITLLKSYTTRVFKKK